MHKTYPRLNLLPPPLSQALVMQRQIHFSHRPLGTSFRHIKAAASFRKIVPIILSAISQMTGTIRLPVVSLFSFSAILHKTKITDHAFNYNILGLIQFLFPDPCHAHKTWYSRNHAYAPAFSNFELHTSYWNKLPAVYVHPDFP